jgi:ankyrin repeat protein
VRFKPELSINFVLRALLRDSRVDVMANMNEPLRTACQNGYVEIVRELLKDNRVNPAYIDNMPLHAACERGHTEVVKVINI